MTELERRALMGDKQAQHECTEKGIVLPCPFCGGRAMIEYGTVEPFEYSVFCVDCGVMPKTSEDEQVAGLAWNTRPAPPIGKCGNCTNACDVGDNLLRCDIFDRDMMSDDFCSQFEPKESE